MNKTARAQITITSVSDGASAWVADLYNQVDSVSCDETGHPVSQQMVSSPVRLFHGNTEKAFQAAGVTRNGASIQFDTRRDGVAVYMDGQELKVYYYADAQISGKDEYALTIQADEDTSVRRTVHFTVNGVKGDVYNLKPSADEIHAARDGSGNYVVGGQSTYNLSCGYTRRAIDGTVVEYADVTGMIDSKYCVYFRRRNRGSQAWDDAYYRYDNVSYESYVRALALNTYDAVEFVLSTSSAGTVTAPAGVIDRETVSVLADGIAGKNAAQVMFDPPVLYVDADSDGKSTAGNKVFSVAVSLVADGAEVAVSSVSVASSSYASVSASYNQQSRKLDVTVLGGAAASGWDGASVKVTLQGGGYTATGLLPVVSKRKGADGVSYQLTCRPASIVFRRNSLGEFPTMIGVDCLVYKSVGGVVTKITPGTTSGVFLFYRMLDGKDTWKTYASNQFVTYAKATDSSNPVTGVEYLLSRYSNSQSDNDVLARTTVPVMLDGMNGDPGSTGKAFYSAGKWDSQTKYTANEYECPLVWIDADSGGRKWYYLPEGESTNQNPKQAGTPGNPWKQAQNNWNVILTEALFADFASFQSAVITGDWLISKHGFCEGKAVNDNNATYLDGGVAKPYYLKFDPTDPKGETTTNFKPNFALDLKTGTLYGSKMDISGTIHAENFFHRICFFDGVNYSNPIYRRTSGYVDYGDRFTEGEYYTLDEILSISDNNLNGETGFIMSTGSSDIVVSFFTEDNEDNEPSYRNHVNLPNPDRYEGKVIRLFSYNIGQYNGDIYELWIDSGKTQFATVTELNADGTVECAPNSWTDRIPVPIGGSVELISTKLKTARNGFTCIWVILENRTGGDINIEGGSVIPTSGVTSVANLRGDIGASDLVAALTGALTSAGFKTTDNNNTYRLTLNGTQKGTTGGTDLGSFYAPTAIGSDGQFLKSGGSGTPSWSALPTATTSQAGIVQLGTVAGTAAEGNHTHSQYALTSALNNYQPLITDILYFGDGQKVWIGEVSDFADSLTLHADANVILESGDGVYNVMYDNSLCSIWHEGNFDPAAFVTTSQLSYYWAKTALKGVKVGNTNYAPTANGTNAGWIDISDEFTGKVSKSGDTMSDNLTMGSTALVVFRKNSTANAGTIGHGTFKPSGASANIDGIVISGPVNFENDGLPPYVAGSPLATQSWVSQNYALTSQLHTHANKDVLDGITATKVSAWDAKQNELVFIDSTGRIANPVSGNQVLSISMPFTMSGSGYMTLDLSGISANIPTATSSVLGGVKVGDTLAISSGVLNQKSGIATAGTYTKVTVDTYGRVTAGAALLTSDIPDLSGTYLPLSGGTLTNAGRSVLTLNQKDVAVSDSGVGPMITFNVGGSVVGYFGFNSTSGFFMQRKGLNGQADKTLKITPDGSLLFADQKVWHAGNDGSTSGLDADLLDGKHLNELFTDLSNVADGDATKLSITIGGITKKIQVTSAINALDADYATYLGTSNVGSTTKGIYLNGGSPAEMTHSLNATVTSGTDGRLAFFTTSSSVKNVASTTNISLINNVGVKRSGSETVIAYRNGLRIWGTCYGNAAANLLSNTAGQLGYGDGGPQIVFSSSASDVAGSSQEAVMLFTIHDNPSNQLWNSGYTFNFFGNPTDGDGTHRVGIVADNLVAKSRLYLASGVYLEYDTANSAMKVSSTEQVINLNASKLQGKEPSYFQKAISFVDTKNGNGTIDGNSSSFSAICFPFNKSVDGRITLDLGAYLLLTGGTLSGNLNLKYTSIDASKAGNNITSTVWPSTMSVLDTSNRIITKFESIVNPNDPNSSSLNGEIGFNIYARQYDTSGTMKAQKGIKYMLSKPDTNGTVTGTWTVNDPASFRNAIGIIHILNSKDNDNEPSMSYLHLPLTGSSGHYSLDLSGVVLTGYLPLTGGTICGTNMQNLVIDSTYTGSDNTALQFRHTKNENGTPTSTVYGGIAMGAQNGSLKRYTSAYAYYDVLDMGNFTTLVKGGGNVSVTKSNNEISISYTHPTNGANTTIAAANKKVLSAITVNNLGHVTSVSSKDLTASDIPSLSDTYVPIAPLVYVNASNQTKTHIKVAELTVESTGLKTVAFTALFSTNETTGSLDKNSYLMHVLVRRESSGTSTYDFTLVQLGERKPGNAYIVKNSTTSFSVYIEKSSGQYAPYYALTPLMVKGSVEFMSVADSLSSETIESATAAVILDYHTHGNKNVLDGITAAKVSAWDAKQDAIAYSLNATVNASTSGYMTYYSDSNAISGSSYVRLLSETNSKSKAEGGLEIAATGYGNAADLISGTDGIISYGDGGPQIRFSPASAQHVALIATHYDVAGAGASLHLVSDQSRVAFVTQEIVGKTRLSVGGNTPNTSYNLYVNGTTNLKGAVIVSAAEAGRASLTVDGTGTFNTSVVVGSASSAGSFTVNGAVTLGRSGQTDSIVINGYDVLFNARSLNIKTASNVDSVRIATMTDLSTYLQKSGGDMTGKITMTGEKTIDFKTTRNVSTGTGWAYAPIRFVGNDGAVFFNFGVYGARETFNYAYIGVNNWDSANNLRIYSDGVKWGGNTIWHAGNDGSTSGLDADLLDGKHASDFCLAGAYDFTIQNIQATTVTGIGIGTGNNANKIVWYLGNDPSATGYANYITVPYATSSGSTKDLAQTALNASTGSLSSFTHATDLIYTAVGGNNNVADKPSSVDAFGVVSFKVASGYYGQILMSAGGGRLYTRSNNTLSGGWNKIAFVDDIGTSLSNYAEITSGTIRIGDNTITPVTSSTLSNYLPLSGGTLTNAGRSVLTLNQKDVTVSDSGVGPMITFKVDGSDVGYFGFNSNSGFFMQRKGLNGQADKTLKITPDGNLLFADKTVWYDNNYVLYIPHTESSAASGARYLDGIRLCGTTVGNLYTANNVSKATTISGITGDITFGDAGPQIQFSTGVNTAQDGALIYTDHDSAGAGASFHFVTNQSDWNVHSKRFVARDSVTIGYQAVANGAFVPNTTHALFVGGSTLITGNTYIGSVSTDNLVATRKWVTDKGYQTNAIETVKVNNSALTVSSKAVNIPIAGDQTAGVVMIGTNGVKMVENHLEVDTTWLANQVSGSYLPKSGGTLTDNVTFNGTGKGLWAQDGTGTYAMFYHNGTNLWIGAEASAKYHHKGATYISAGWSGSAGNPTIYVSVPTTNSTTATNTYNNYAVLHAGNYTSYLTGYQSKLHFYNTKNSNTEAQFSNLYLPLANVSSGNAELDLSGYLPIGSRITATYGNRTPSVAGSTTGYVLIGQFTHNPGTGGYRHSWATLLVGSRHNGSQIVNIIFGCEQALANFTLNNAFCDISQFGTTANSTADDVFYCYAKMDGSNIVWSLFWRNRDYSPADITVLQSGGNATFTLSNGAWMTSIDGDAYGTLKGKGKRNPASFSCTLWGQSFDGTGNVDGKMTINYTGTSAAELITLKAPNASYNCIAYNKVGTNGLNWSVGINASSYYFWNSSNGTVVSIDNAGNLTTGSKITINGGQVTDDSKGIQINASDKTKRALIAYNGNTAAIDNAYLKIEAQYGHIALMPQTSGGNVGIGTTSPAYKLDVNGSANVSGNLYVGGIEATQGISVNGTSVSLVGHTHSGYATTDSLASYLPLSGGTLTGNLYIGSEANVNRVVKYSEISNHLTYYDTILNAVNAETADALKKTSLNYNSSSSQTGYRRIGDVTIYASRGKQRGWMTLSLGSRHNGAQIVNIIYGCEQEASADHLLENTFCEITQYGTLTNSTADDVLYCYAKIDSTKNIYLTFFWRHRDDSPADVRVIASGGNSVFSPIDNGAWITDTTTVSFTSSYGDLFAKGQRRIGVLTSYLKSTKSGLGTNGYWGKIWDIALPKSTTAMRKEMVFMVSDPDTGYSGVSILRLKHSYNTTSNKYTFPSVVLEQVYGNVPMAQFRVYYSLVNGKVELWCNLTSYTKYFNFTVLKQTADGAGDDAAVLGFWYPTDIQTAQTLPTVVTNSLAMVEMTRKSVDVAASSLTIAGSIKAQFSAGTLSFSRVNPNDAAPVYSFDGQVTSGSDSRMKTIDAYLEPSVYDIAFSPLVAFRWKNGNGRQNVGTLAQYWEKVLPQAVHTDNNGYLSLEYSTIALAAGVTASRKAVDNERRILELEREVSALKTRVAELEQEQAA